MDKRLVLALHYILDILKKTVKISKAYSPKFALYGLLWWIGFFVRTKFSWNLTSYAQKNKTKWLDNYFEKKYAGIINKYKNVCLDQSPNNNTPVIWIFWGQGEKEMPSLVKACYRQLTYYNSNVHLISDENIDQFISIDPIIIGKVKKRKIGYANFSDIVRNTVLARYGGLWLDSTVWVSGVIPFQKLNTLPIFTANNEEVIDRKSIKFWSSYEWNWSSWCLWSRNTGHPFFCFVSDMLTAIALREDVWPDYVIQDYLFYYACRNIPGIKEQMDMINLHNPNKDQLAFLMPKEFDSEQYKKLTEKECFFKLRYRTPWPMYTKGGKETFYGRILRNII